jgi:DNA polymerase III subunit gamma/tau
MPAEAAGTQFTFSTRVCSIQGQRQLSRRRELAEPSRNCERGPALRGHDAGVGHSAPAMAKKTTPTTPEGGAQRPAEATAAQAKPNPGAAAMEPGRPAQPARAHYVVLARKYRPATFDDLIGQDAMVRTLKNAFATDRIAQGYMLTGVRGVGKTTTARILARALNYERDGVEKPTFDMPVPGRHCAEIMEGRHPDVIEMDAASNTSVDNMREVIESARYRPLLARYKVFLIDEVHMLSKAAFNALLKTLEEPPEHVKFIFATTEVRKVPVTVLSRCQRFDLRRVEVPLLVQHFRAIAAKEGTGADEEALGLIARAAQGSVRDGLSLLDQALAMGAGRIEAAQVRAMLGLADRGRLFDLVERLLAGAAAEALELFARLHRDGAEPQQILGDLAEVVHAITRAKAFGSAAASEELSAEERRRAGALGGRLSMAILARAWQLLLKGLEEEAEAPNPTAAAEMVLIRLAYAADLPPPDEIVRALQGNGSAAQPGAKSAAGAPPRAPAATASSASAAAGPAVTEEDDPVDNGEDGGELEADADALDELDARRSLPMARSFADVVELAGTRRDAKLKVHLEKHVSLVSFDPVGRIELHLLAGAPKELGNDLREKLNAWTGRRWVVALSNTPGERTIEEVRLERKAVELSEIKKHPAVVAVLRQFPDATIEVKPLPGAKPGDTGTG